MTVILACNTSSITALQCNNTSRDCYYSTLIQEEEDKNGALSQKLYYIKN